MYTSVISAEMKPWPSWPSFEKKWKTLSDLRGNFFKEAGKGKKGIMGENSEWTSGAALPFPKEHGVTHVHLSMHLLMSSIPLFRGLLTEQHTDVLGGEHSRSDPFLWGLIRRCRKMTARHLSITRVR